MAAGAAATAKGGRRAAVQAFKRRRIREAAREVFAENGLDGATMRAIAARAGYTAGAIYHHYQGKEEIYGDLLAESLAALHAHVRDAMAAAVDPAERAAAAARAFFAYYRAQADELYLGLYLYRGAGPSGLTPELDRQLNGRLIRVLGLIAEALAATTGRPAAEANRRTVDLAAHMIGLLLMETTGRLRVLGFDAAELLDERLAELLGGRPGRV